MDARRQGEISRAPSEVRSPGEGDSGVGEPPEGPRGCRKRPGSPSMS